MKYIRLKDGRIIVQGEPSDKGFGQGRFEVHNFGNVETLTPFSNDDILVESSSIDELFDKLIAVNKFNPKEHFTLAYRPKEPSKGTDVYGCIWTTGAYGEPILKAVTKPMNEKGKWELL